MRIISLLTPFALLAATGLAQSASTPTLGYSISDNGRSFRPILGVPGAGRVGGQLAIPDGLDRVQLSPGSAHAFALRGGVPVILDLNTLTGTVLPRARSASGTAAFSATGTSVAVWSKENDWIQVFARVNDAWTLTLELPQAALQAMPSDDGSALLYTTSAGLALYRNAASITLDPDSTAAFTFFARTAQPAWWSGNVLHLENRSVPLDASPDAAERLLSSPAEGRLLALQAGAANVRILDLNGLVVSEHHCQCAIRSLAALGRGSAIRLVSDAAGPLWLADLASPQPRVFFVPPPPTISKEQ